MDTVLVGGQAPLPQYTVELEIYPRRQGYNGYHSTHPLRVDLDSGLGSSPSRRWLKEGKAVSTLPVGQWASGVRFGGCGALGRTRGRGGEVRVLGLTRGPPSRTRQAASCLTTQKAAKAGLLALVESSHKSGFPLLACAQPPSSAPLVGSPPQTRLLDVTRWPGCWVLEPRYAYAFHDVKCRELPNTTVRPCPPVVPLLPNCRWFHWLGGASSTSTTLWHPVHASRIPAGPTGDGQLPLGGWASTQDPAKGFRVTRQAGPQIPF